MESKDCKGLSYVQVILHRCIGSWRMGSIFSLKLQRKAGLQPSERER